MNTAKLFMNGRSQAVRLPKAYRFEDNEVYIKKVGNAVLLLPVLNPWQVLTDSLNLSSGNFMETREQPEQQERETFE